jgi:uncharacterized protein (TIGR03435 family)
VAFGNFFLMDFHSCLKKPPRKNAPAFFTVTTGPTATINLIRDHLINFPCLTNGVRSILSSILERQVIDQTGVEGSFDFNMEWVPDPSQAKLPPGVEPNFDPNGVSIFTAIQEQLGLRLDSQKRPVEILIIDDIRRPSEN